MKQNSEHLGKKAKDIITGFTGIVTGHVSYITGCDQLLIVGKSDGNSEAPSQWYDLNRVEVKEKKKPLSIPTDVHAGPDRAAPIK